MSFLKNLFGDDSTLVGLCGFKFVKTVYKKAELEHNFFFNPFDSEKVFETNYVKNNLLL